MSNQNKASKLTRIIHAGLNSDQQYHTVVPPLTMTSNFRFKEFGVPNTYEYSRTHNPIRDILGQAISALESAAGTIVTSTGMSAVHLPFLTFLKSGDLVYAPQGSYGCTIRLLNTLQDKGHLNVEWLDFTDIERLESSFARQKPDMVFMESASNPLLNIFDITKISQICKAHKVRLVVDNTFMPTILYPLELGADIVVHSTTKYLNGHGDITGGSVSTKNEDDYKQMLYWVNNVGTTGSPFDSFQILRGMRTLFSRMQAHQNTALFLLDKLVSHDAIESVFHPSLENHNGHQYIRQNGHGFGGVLTFSLKGGEAAARSFCDGLTWFTMAESLGGFESLIAHPPTMTHAMVSPSARRKAGIVDGMLRLSIGLEDKNDLWEDVRAGLDRALN